jgi:predicted  nucleic acid-binding Zn-ribbon protein
MSRSTYKCGGSGKHGIPPKECTRCGRRHPKGKKQKQKAQDAGWASCKSIAATRNARKGVHTPVVSSMFSSSEDEAKRKASNMRNRERNAAAKAERIKLSQGKPTFTPQEQIKRLDAKFGVGKGAKKERKKLNEKLENTNKN